jgi:hypothetical protein
MSEEPRQKKAKVENSENLKVAFAIFSTASGKRVKIFIFFFVNLRNTVRKL